MNRRPQLGFTAIELIITLAIAAILIGMAVPSFVSVVDDAKLGKLVEPTNRALMLARSEAARSRADVTVCPRATDTTCGTDWDNGLLVFVDGVVNPTDDEAVRDNDDPILMIVEPHDTDNTLKAVASTDRTANTAFAPKFIRYGFDGRASWANGTLIACDRRGVEHSRAINVTLTGSIRRARTDGSGDVVENAFGNEISCS